MDTIKIECCRAHLRALTPLAGDSPTAKHLAAAVEIAERLLRENNRLEMECREWRLKQVAGD